MARKLSDLMDELFSHYGDLVLEEGILEEEKAKRFLELREEIIDSLLWDPGQLIQTKSEDQTDRLKLLMSVLMKGLEKEEIVDVLLDGGYNGLLSLQLDTFSERVKMLEPTFYSNEKLLSKEFLTYYREAMKAWMNGLDHACIILSFSILENLIKNEVEEIEPEALVVLVPKSNPQKVEPASIGSIFKKAYELKMLTYEHKEYLFWLKKLRNNMIHENQKVKSEQSYEVIQKAKEITEYILNQN